MSSAQIAAVMRDSESCSVRFPSRWACSWSMTVSICRPQMAGPPCLNWPSGFRCVTLCGGLPRWAFKERATGSLEWGTRRHMAFPVGPEIVAGRVCGADVDDGMVSQTRGAPNQGHSRTPAKGPRCSTWPTLPFGSAASVLPSCCTGQGPALAVFRETAGRSRVFRVFHAAVQRRDSLNSFHRRQPPVAWQNIESRIERQPAGLGLSGAGSASQPSNPRRPR